MKYHARLAAAALSLLLLAGCASSDHSGDCSLSSSAASGSTGSVEQGAMHYDCGSFTVDHVSGDLTVAIPLDYAELLTVRQGESPSRLLSVYEKTSLEEAAQAGEENAQEAGWLFSLVRCDFDQYMEALEADIPGLDFFARDDNWFYGWATPTDVRLYRQGTVTEEDSAQWEQALAVSGLVKSDFIARYEFMTAQSTVP